MGSISGTEAYNFGHELIVPKTEGDSEPMQVSGDELKQRLGSDILESIAGIRNDADEAFEDTSEIEVELIRRAKEQLGLTKEEDNG